MCAAPAPRSARAAACRDAPLVITSSSSTSRLPGNAVRPAAGPRQTRFRTLRRRSLRASVLWGGVSCTRSNTPCATLDGVQRAGQCIGLVVAALAQPLHRQWHGQQQVGSVQRGLHPGRGAQQARKTGGPARALVEFEVCNQIRPRVGIGQGCQTGIPWRCLQDAGAALAHARCNRQSTGGATRDRLRERAHAGLADAVRWARHGIPRTGWAGAAISLGAVDETPSQYTRAALLPTRRRRFQCLPIFPPPSRHAPPRVGRPGYQPLPRGCTRRWRAAWKNVCSG